MTLEEGMLLAIYLFILCLTIARFLCRDIFRDFQFSRHNQKVSGRQGNDNRR